MSTVRINLEFAKENVMDLPCLSSPTLQTPESNLMEIKDYIYNPESILGRGSTSIVYKAVDMKARQIAAIKRVPKRMLRSEHLVASLLEEISIHKKISHPNVLGLKDVIRCPNNIYLISEYCNAGTLRDYIKTKGKLTENEAKQVLFQISEGLYELNKNNVLHRDIKPENILCHVDNGVMTFKICDFGQATSFSSSELMFNSFVGSPQYMDPQRLSGEEYSVKADVFSLGVIAYELMFGCAPWTTSCWHDLKNTIVSQALKFPPGCGISSDMEDFIRKTLAISESDRASWREVKNHNLFKNL